MPEEDQKDAIEGAAAEIERRTAERYAAGEYPEDLDEALLEHYRVVQRTQEANPDQLQLLLQKLDAASRFGAHRIPYISSVPMGPQLHRMIGRAVGRQTAGVLLQLSEFAAVTRELLAAVIDRLPEQQRALESAAQLNARVDGLLDQLARTARAERGAVPPEVQPRPAAPEAESRAHAELAGRFTGQAPVLDLRCEGGEMLRALAELGIEASGVSQDPELVAACRLAGFRATVADSLDYLLSLDDGTLGGLFAGHLIEDLVSIDVGQLVAAAQRKLRPGGKLVVVSGGAPDRLRRLCEEAGFASTEVEEAFGGPAAGKLEPLPEGGGLDPQVREALNRNFERLNQLVLAPADYALIATR